MRVLVDSSVWIDYFKGKKHADSVNTLIDNNIICINDLILAEIIPYLKVQKQKELIEALYAVENISIQINWQNIIDMQIRCIQAGINKIGIADLIIVQNAMEQNLLIFSFDKHFILMASCLKIKLWNKE